MGIKSMVIVYNLNSLNPLLASVNTNYHAFLISHSPRSPRCHGCSPRRIVRTPQAWQAPHFSRGGHQNCRASQTQPLSQLEADSRSIKGVIFILLIYEFRSRRLDFPIYYAVGKVVNATHSIELYLNSIM